MHTHNQSKSKKNNEIKQLTFKKIEKYDLLNSINFLYRFAIYSYLVFVFCHTLTTSHWTNVFEFNWQSLVMTSWHRTQFGLGFANVDPMLVKIWFQDFY